MICKSDCLSLPSIIFRSRYIARQVMTLGPALLVTLNLEEFEILSHEIEYGNELTMAFIDLVSAPVRVPSVRISRRFSHVPTCPSMLFFLEFVPKSSSHHDLLSPYRQSSQICPGRYSSRPSFSMRRRVRRPPPRAWDFPLKTRTIAPLSSWPLSRPRWQSCK